MLDEEEFRQKLKELCLRYDLENGEQCEGPSYPGSEIFDFYIEENGLDWEESKDYLRQLHEKEEVENEPQKEVEYFISEEPPKLGDLVCDGHTALPIGVVTGIIEEGIAVDGGFPYALPQGRFLIKTPLKKLDVCEKQE